MVVSISGTSIVHTYSDSLRKARLVDEYEAGKLTARSYFIAERIVARDRIKWIGNNPDGKERTYYEPNGMQIMAEQYTSDGLSVVKRYCSSGTESSCVNYAKNDRSPLPPLLFLIAAYGQVR